MKLASRLILTALIGIIPLKVDASQTVDMTIAAARDAAHEDRNDKAAQLFAQAVAAEPHRRLELLPELASQLTYAGKSTQAIPLFREVVASHTLEPQAERHAELSLALALSWNHRLGESLATYSALLRRNPRDIDALLGYARVLSWKDQLTPSLREYELVLALDPGNLEAGEGIARVQSWRGRQRAAQREAHAVLSTHQGDVEAAETLAQSELWMGRPDIAKRDDMSLLRAHPNDSTARAFTMDIADALSPRIRISQSVGTQSDGFTIRTGMFESEAHDSAGLTSFGFRYQPISYVGQNPIDDTTEHRLGLFGRRRLNDWSEVNVNLNNDNITATGAATKNLLLYNTYLTFWPSDTLRFDVGSHRDTFDNVTSLSRGITAVFDNVSMDVTPDENTRLSVRADRANFSDGNRRSWEQVEVERAVVRRPRLSFGARATTYSFSQSLNNGYFDPLRYNSAEFTTHLYGDMRGRFFYDVAGSYGREWVAAGGARPTHAIHGALSYVLSRPISIAAVYDSFDTRQFSNGGFARTVIGVRLETRW